MIENQPLNNHGQPPGAPGACKKFEPGSLAFLKASALVAKGYKSELVEDDLLPISETDQAENLADQLRDAWHWQKGEKPSLWPVLAKVFGLRYFGISLLAVGASTCKIGSALLLGQFIDFLQVADAPIEKGLFYGGGLALSMLLFSFFESHFMMKAYRIGVNARVAVLSFLYSHLLSLNLASLPAVGQALNVISNDAQRLEDAGPLLLFFILGPIETLVVFGITWWYIGIASLAAYGSLAILILLLSTNVARFKKARSLLVEARDQRIRILSDVIRFMDMVKLYAWEQPFVQRILKFRNDEIKHLQRWYALKGINASFYWSAQSMMSIVGFFTLFFGMGRVFSSQNVFTSLLLFGTVKENMGWRVPRSLELLADLRVSIARIEEILHLEPVAETSPTGDHTSSTVLSFEHASFAWDNQPVLHDINLQVEAGDFVAVIGQVGSGKTSLLLSALGQLKTVSGSVHVADASYTPQSAFVFAGSIKENILMGAALDPMRLKRVLDVCQLESDVAQWEHGLETRIGGNGSKVSGGQRARICLARALYNAGSVFLLDDIFSALDAQVAANIFAELRVYLKDSAVVLVTHHLGLVAQCDSVAYMSGGRILASGPLESVIAMAAHYDPDFAQVVAEFSEPVGGSASKKPGGPAPDVHVAPAGSSSGGAAGGGIDDDVLAPSDDWNEQAQTGFDASVFLRFLKMSGGGAIFAVALVLGMATCALQALSDYWLTSWAAAAPDEQFDPYYWKSYLALTVFIPVAAMICSYGFFTVIIRSSTRLFERMLHNVVKASPHFFSVNPAGRILNRMGKDMAMTDELLPDAFAEVLRLWLFVVMIIITVAMAVPYVLLAIAPIVVIFVYLRRQYVEANRQVRRMEALSRSPVYSHVVDSVEGIATVTALRRQPQYFDTFCALLDQNTRALLSFYTVERWLCLRVDCLACVIIAATSGCMIGFKSTLGLTLASLAQMYVLNLVDVTQYNVRKTAELELQLVAVERIMEYASEIPLESQRESPAGAFPGNATWPSAGVVEFKDMSLQYEGADRPALRNITLSTRPGEKIGIVGRTGAGKSSVISTLFRLAEPSPGGVTIDGVNITDLGLADLRSRLSIIPQSLYLFQGSVRFNLDPFGTHADHELWTVLDKVDLKGVVERFENKLDDRPQFSSGEGQLFQLARVLLRKSKVLILDECSSNIDVATDRIMQQTIRREFGDCTILTIAHRIDTIIDNDRVLCLDKGQVAEFDAPTTLLRDPQSIFYSLAEKSLGKDKRLRVRTKFGLATINDPTLDARTATVYDLSSTIVAEALAKSLPSNVDLDSIRRSLSIRMGVPPRPLAPADPTTLLAEAGVRSGEQLTVEFKDPTPAPPAASSASTSVPKAAASSSARNNGKPAPSSSRSPPTSSTPDLSPEAINAIALGDHVHVPDLGGFLVVRESRNDNNCLFHSIAYVLAKGMTVYELRTLVIAQIRANPDRFDAVVLGRPVDEYCTWIAKLASWGGAIELAIFADYFRTEICSVDVQTLRIDRFGEGKYPTRAFVLYNGIHYDAVGLTPALDAPRDFDAVVFDVANRQLLQHAVELAGKLHKQHRFTDTANFTLRCVVCDKGLQGQHAAHEHAMQTGHTNFTEYK
ncbi:hypothetical protein GGF32_007731 [Allomyces javanicus]|nr:hypothetical protein GGF32_007731 [Allomyces javanicus]